MQRHTLDPYPIPKDKTPLYINEPGLIDRTVSDEFSRGTPDEIKEDNVRVYIPMDLNREAILRRLDHVIARYEEANEDNEWRFQSDVEQIIAQIEIYDQIWYVRHMPAEGKHSAEAIELVKEFIARLEDIPDGCAECFPFEMIEGLSAEYLDE